MDELAHLGTQLVGAVADVLAPPSKLRCASAAHDAWVSVKALRIVGWSRNVAGGGGGVAIIGRLIIINTPG